MNDLNAERDWLADEEDQGPRLSWAERNGFPNWLIGLGGLIVAFGSYFIILNVGSLVILFSGGPLEGLSPEQIVERLLENPSSVIIVNSIAQFLGLALPVVLFALLARRGSSSELFRLNTGLNVLQWSVAAFVLTLAFWPVTMFLGYLNSILPLPESVLNYNSEADKLLVSVIEGNVLFAIANVAIVPAICEELMYRGFGITVLRRSWGIWPAIIIGGLCFGAMHMKPAAIIPLSTLGVVFGIITWKSGSLIPAMVAHFVNNAGSILLARQYPQLMETEAVAESLPPFGLILAGALISGVIFYFMFRFGAAEEHQ